MIAPDFARLLEVTGPVSRETFDRLVTFETLFKKWASRMNLSAPSTLNDVWTRHILDSAQLLPIEPEARHWIDLGSGGGFPGLIIAILLLERGDSHVDLIESNGKKAAFLQSVTGQLRLPAKVHSRRIDDAHALVSTADVVTARALASLPVLLGLAAPWLTAGAKGLFHKGRDYRAEIEESTHRWSFDLIEHRSMTDSQSVILEIRHLRSKS